VLLKHESFKDFVLPLDTIAKLFLIIRVLGNILWHFPFFGFLSAIGTFLIGGLLFITIIGVPIGLGLFQLGKFLFSPFSSAMVDRKELKQQDDYAWNLFGLIIRVLYFPFGLVLALATICQIAGLFITIVGIPIALVLAKSLGTYFNPVNKVCVPVAVRDEIAKRKAQEQITNHLG
jgi:uncharacterized membrane protein YccF (DUF307 family)